MEQRVERPHVMETGLVQLLMRLPDQLSALMKSQATLAKVEVKAKMAQAIKYSVLLAAGAFLAYIGLLAAVATAIIVVGIFIPLWISALIFTLVLLIGGGVLALVGISSLKRMKWAPNKTIETVKENIRWLKQQRS